MATKYLPSSSKTYSYDKGKYRFKMEYSYSSNAFNFKCSIIITEATKSKHYINLRWKDKYGSWKSYKSSSSHKKKGTVEFTARATDAKQLEVQMQFGGNGWKKFAVINPTYPVYTPTVDAEMINDSLATLTITGDATSTKYVNKLIIERKEDNGTFSSIRELTGNTYISDYELSWDDTTITAGHYYQYRVKAVKDSTESEYSAETEAFYTTPSSAEISGSVNAQRISNRQVNVSWALSSVTPVQLGLIEKFILMRSINDGAFDDIKTIDAITSTTHYSYQDTGTTADNIYKYAIDFVNREGARLYAPIESETEIKMTPNAPIGLSVSLDSNNYPVLEITNVSNSADYVCIERKDGTAPWTQEAQMEYPCERYSGDDGAAVVSTETVQYRIRNFVDDSSLPAADRYSGYCSAGTGGGSGSGGITIDTKSKPEPPTLISPFDGSKFALDEGQVRLEWIHNPTDGSAQESAEVQYSANGGSSWITKTVQTARSYLLDISEMQPNATVTWRVRTKGAYNQSSEYSQNRTFTLLAKPLVSFLSPHNADVINSLPITFRFNYSDESGTLEKLTIEVIKEHKTVIKADINTGSGRSGEYTYVLDSFMPDNNTTYSLRVSARSSSGFAAYQTISITVQFEEVAIEGGLLPTVIFDPDTGYAKVQLMRDITDDEGHTPTPISITAAYLYRIHDGETLLVASGLKEGSQITDKYAPTNIDYAYKLLQITASGTIGVSSVDVNNQTPYWFVYWGDNIARAKWNPEGSVSLGRPQKKKVMYSGRRHHVSYDQDAEQEEFSFNTKLTEREEINMFRQMMRDGGSGIWKSADGDVYDADFEFNYSPNLKDRERTWDAELKVTRKDSGR